uniref:hypothetical protein n=1 Tax=Saccharothrix mutabilis TaxID=33921 RepID=UPI0031D27C8D
MGGRPAGELPVEQLRGNGVRVDLALSTGEGVARFDKGRYRAVKAAGADVVTDSPFELSQFLRAQGLLDL